MLPISRRTQGLGTENAFVVLGEVNRLLAEGRDIANFCIGQPDFPTPKNVQEAACKAVREGKHGYTPSPGIPGLRAAVARYFTRTRGVAVEPGDVVCGCGGKPFIAYTILSVTDYGAGDEVIYPVPGFPIYDAQIKAHGAVGRPLPLRESRRFSFDMDELKALVNAKTRLLILCSPQNPTGGMLSAQDLRDVAAIVRPFEDLWIYSDEVYSQLYYDEKFRTIAAEEGLLERTVIADSLSKTYAMTGWRLGFAANRKLSPSFERWVTNTDSCPPHPIQWAGIEALDGPQDEPARMAAEFKKRRDRIVAGLNAIEGVSCVNPGGAFYVWPNVSKLCEMTGSADSEVVRQRLLREAGVAVLSDVHFGPRIAGEGQHIRFSYAASIAAIDEGLARLASWAKKNKR